MKKIIILFSFLFVITAGNAQTSPFDWQYCFGSSYNNFPGNMCKTGDGGYIMTGAYKNFGGDFISNYGGIDIGAIKIDANGQKIWSKNYGAGGVEFSSGIIKGTQGRYYILGYTTSTTLPNFQSTTLMNEGYIVCIDSLGNLIWQSCYGGNYEDNFYSGVEKDGYLYAAATCKNGAPTGTTDVYVYKIDASTGHVIKAKGFGGTKDDYVNKIIETNDHNLLIVGSSLSNDVNIPVNYGFTDAWVLKIDSGLNVISSKIWGGMYKDLFASVINLSNNEYVFYGLTNNPDTLIGNLHVIAPNPYCKLLLIKTDSNFNEIWQKGYGCRISKISENYGSNNFIETLDHGFIMGARGEPYQCEPQPFEGYSRFIKVDSTGKEVFEKYFGTESVGDVRSVNETAYGSIVVYDFGVRDSNNICRRPDVYYSFWNVYQWSYGLNFGVEAKNNEKYALLVYPNPATNTITFETAINKLQLQVYNISGQLLTDKQLHAGSNTLDVSNYAQGMYFYRLTDTDNYFKSGKFVKE